MLLLSVMTATSAQKLAIKTANGQTIEITCEGMMPSEVIVINDSVVFKMPAKTVQVDSAVREVMPPPVDMVDDSDSIDTFIPVEQSDILQNADTVEVDTLSQNFTATAQQSALGFFANSLAEELSPEYAQFNREQEGTHPESERELVKDLAKKFVDEDVVETADFLGTIFGGLRFTKDTSFVAKYEQRKPKKLWRSYDIIELEGSFGRNIPGLSEKVEEEVKYDDYGDDAENENKIGGGIRYSRVYLSGSENGGAWKPNPLGFAVSWGGILSYSYEKDMGSYLNVMGKAGIQIGNDIAIGIDVLMGCGITPYNTFYTNYINHSLLSKSAFCFKYGLQVWGSLNFSKDTYTSFYGRYIRSVKPAEAFTKLPEDWDMILEDFDPSSWTVGLAVGYKFGAPHTLSQDKRLQIGFSTGYQFVGKQKGVILSAEFERLTKVSYSTTLNYGLAVERLSEDGGEKDNYTSVLFSAGFKVNQPSSKLFWGAKLYGGVGDCAVVFIGERVEAQMSNITKKLCAKMALQLNSGLKLGKCSEIFAACRFGYHLSKALDIEGYDDSSYENLRGFELDTRLGCKFTF